MEKENMSKAALFVVLMLLFRMGYSFPMAPVVPRPLCRSQLALANRACALLPYSQGPVDSTPGQSSEPPGSPPPPASSTADDSEDDHSPSRDGHSPSEGDHGDEHHHRHGHGHGRHRHQTEPGTVIHHIKTVIEAECCRWLAQVDDECVCTMLVHLPPFLARPVHEYTVTVAEACSITYECNSALIP